MPAKKSTAPAIITPRVILPGTERGITAIQMDLKVHGLTPEIIKEAFAKTHKARNYILDEIMLPVISEPTP